MILYLTNPAQLDELASSQTICFPVSLLEERYRFAGSDEVAKRIRQVRRLKESTRIIRSHA